VIVVRARALVWVVSIASCGPTTKGYCDRLHEDQPRIRDSCPEFGGGEFDFHACPTTLDRSCSRTDLELLHDKLDCFELLTDCEERDALSECQNDLPYLSLTCDEALEDLSS
jgi:hypothetical protein